MRKLFEKVIHIYAQDIPYEIRDEELTDNEGICLHGDDGSVNHFNRWDLENAYPKFKRWMIEIGAWTEAETDLPDYDQFCKLHGLNEGEPYHFEEYYAWKGDREESLTVAFSGT